MDHERPMRIEGVVDAGLAGDHRIDMLDRNAVNAISARMRDYYLEGARLELLRRIEEQAHVSLCGE